MRGTAEPAEFAFLRAREPFAMNAVRPARTATKRQELGEASASHRAIARLGEQILDDVPMHIGQATIDAVIAKREFGVIDAQEV